MTQPPTLDQTVTLYIRSLAGRNTSALTTLAYQTDLTQFLTWVKENDATITSPGQVERTHITDYLSHLSDLGRSGVTRARKLAVIRELFKYLLETGVLLSKPTHDILYSCCYYPLQQNLVLWTVLMALQANFSLRQC